LIREVTTNISGNIIITENIEISEFLKVYTTLLNGKDKISGYNLLLINGKLIVRERPGAAHESLSGHMDHILVAYKGIEAVLLSGCSTRFQYGANSSLEPDQCFFNRHIPSNDRIRDANGLELPSIIIEINLSESYASTDETAQIYLNNIATRVVISIKLVISHAQNQNIRGKITQMYFILYRQRDRQQGEGRVNPIKVVSFGASAETSSMNAILRHTRVNPVHFTGVGRTTGLQNDTANTAPFQVIIDADDIWYNVPDDVVQNIPRDDFNIDLFEVLSFLRDREWSANITETA